MKNLKITWKGVTPLIMNSCKGVNPLHPITIEMKKYTSKRKKTEEDLVKISDLEWEQRAYWKDEVGGLYIPAENVEATIINGGKAFKRGTDLQKFTDVTDLYIPFEYGEKLSLEQLIQNYEYRDTRPMTVQRAKVMRTRPRFDKWQIQFNLRYNEEKIDLVTITNALEYAGSYVGLCDSRPKYGKFVAIVEELD